MGLTPTLSMLQEILILKIPFFFNQTELIRNTCDMPLYYQKPPETNQISMFLLSFFPKHFKMKVRKKKKGGVGVEGKVLFSLLLTPNFSLPSQTSKQVSIDYLMDARLLLSYFLKCTTDC